MKIKKKLYFVIAIIVTGVIFFFLGMGSNPGKGKAEEGTPAQTIIIRDETGFANAISAVAEALTPTVVYINVTGTVIQRAPDFGYPFGDDPFFRYFFGPPQQSERQVPISALGSGVIISKDGYIITNNHVVQNADKITVTLFDGTTHDAKLIGTDPRTDLAVVKIDPVPGMKYAEFGDSDAVKVGEWVVAIGSPRGLSFTVTAGIISAKNRTNIGVLGPTGYEDFIQTDAAINPGNSGGPLINLKGKVIGINALIVSASQGSEGLGFAIPSNMAKAISESLIKTGKVTRGYLGVQIQDITPEMLKSLKLEKGFRGVIVADVFENGPAEKAGIQQGDIIVSYEGKVVESVPMLRNMVAQTAPGTNVKLVVLRDKKEIEFTVKIGDLEKVEGMAMAPGGNELLGLSVEKVTPEIARSKGLKTATGVIITDVISGSPAERAGLEVGDIIMRVGNDVVNEVKDFNEKVAKAAKSGEVLLLIRDGRSGRVGYVVIPVG
ncbi:MAG: DegQ family serine endoprotease [Spirochaetota bacterium]